MAGREKGKIVEKELPPPFYKGPHADLTFSTASFAEIIVAMKELFPVIPPEKIFFSAIYGEGIAVTVDLGIPKTPDE